MKNENREKLIGILTDICPDVDFENEDALIDEIMAEFDVEINVDDLLPENFNSVDAILELIDSKKD